MEEPRPERERSKQGHAERRACQANGSRLVLAVGEPYVVGFNVQAELEVRARVDHQRGQGTEPRPT
jgi:hypothetical protein